jgi:PleD family two-component response regulator
MARTFPLHDEGRLIGAIELFSNDKLPTELLKDMEELKVLARTDQLTGLANRRYTESLLSGKLRVLEEFKTSFTVAMVDIDHFKVTKSLVNAVRVEDIVGRWGGEEFLVVFSAVGIEQLELITERLRMLVEASSIQREGANIQVTVSIGSVAVESPTSMDKIIHLVDQLMYQSKQKGRNCFTLGAL